MLCAKIDKDMLHSKKTTEVEVALRMLRAVTAHAAAEDANHIAIVMQYRSLE